MKNKIIGALAALFLITACQDPVYLPKPRGYPRIEFPERSYEDFGKDYCAFNFEKPSYVKVVQDTLFFGETPESPCWFDLDIPALNAKIHCTYKEIDKENTLTEMVSDSYAFANKHNVKADYIDDLFLALPGNVYCRILEIEGDVASPYQFYVTDSTRHFLRGSLYFASQPKRDSLAPAIDFVREDIEHMLKTFKWASE